MVVGIVPALPSTTRCATLKSAPVPMRTSGLSSASSGATNTTTTSSIPGYPMSTRMVGVEPPPCREDCGGLWRDRAHLTGCFFPLQRPESVSWAADQRRRERWSSWTRWCTMGPAAATRTLSACAHVESVWWVVFHFWGQEKGDLVFPGHVQRIYTYRLLSYLKD